MDKMIRRADVQGNVEVGEVIYNLLAFADDLVLLMDDVNHLQEGINRLNVACEEFGMKINVSKTKVMHVGKNRKEVVCELNDQVLEQVSEFKYLGTMFCEDGKLVKEIDHRRKNGNAVASQLRSHVFNKKELSADTKLSIHRSIFRPTILYGSESWVDCGYLVHDLEVADMNVLRMIAKTSRRQQWDEHIRNEDIRVNLGVNSVEEAARVSRLRWFGHVQRVQSDRLPRRIMSEEVQGKRGRGRPRRRFLDSVRSDLEIRGLRLDDHTLALAQDRVAWRRMIHH